MNLAHRWLCRSAYWRNAVETYIFPWVLDGLDIGANVLEVGPGPGVTTDLLRERVECLTCVEIDRAFADSLSRRMSGHNVTVVQQDATAMSFLDATFDAALSFTMLHHVPSEAMQNRLLAEVARVLRPRRRFCGHGQFLQPFISSASPHAKNLVSCLRRGRGLPASRPSPAVLSANAFGSGAQAGHFCPGANKQAHHPCRNRALTIGIRAIWVNFEREADSPNC